MCFKAARNSPQRSRERRIWYFIFLLFVALGINKQLDLQKANLELARTTMERYKGADKEEAVAKLAVDQSIAQARRQQKAIA